MMTRRCLWVSLLSAMLLGALALPAAEVEAELLALIRRQLPESHLQTNATGNPSVLVSGSGELLDLAKVARENPEPADGVGYRESPAMQFLSRQAISAATAAEAADAVRLLHALWRGSGFVRQKVYEARPIEGGWVVRVEHDFTNYPGSVQSLMPYELLVDSHQRVTRLRERCYYFPGSAVVYTNTVRSVYEQEKTNQNGLYYPEALEKELRKAWEAEQAKPHEGPPGTHPGKGQ
jgi:hypothetical protein